MPIFDFQCPHGHVNEVMFRSFAAVTETMKCQECGEEARQLPGVPAPAHFYGNPDGYHKPSPANRHSTKVVSAKDGNKHSIG